MTGFRRTLIVGALALSFAFPLVAAQAQGGPPGTTQNQGYGRGYGPGMMGEGFSYGPGMMGGYGAGYGPQMMWGRGGYGPGMMWGGGGNGPGDAATAVNFAEGRLTFLKAELKITAQQEPAWNHYAQTVRDTAKTVYAQHQLYFDHLQTDEGLPQRLDEREQVMATAYDAMRKNDAALKPLYAALSADQKQVADRYLGFPMMAGGGMF